jgi:hypothetical protein
MFIYHEKSQCITVNPKLTIRELSKRLSGLDRTLGYMPMDGQELTLETCLSRRIPNRYFLRYGDIADLCTGWIIGLPGGEAWSVKPYPRAATGPDFRHTLIGSGKRLPLRFESCTLKVFQIPEDESFVLAAFDASPSPDVFIHWMQDHFIRPFGVWAGPTSRLPNKTFADLKETDALVLVGLCGDKRLVKTQEAAVSDYLEMRKGRPALVSSAIDKALFSKILHGSHPESAATIHRLSYTIPAGGSPEGGPALRYRAPKSWLDEEWQKIYKRYEEGAMK